MSHKDILLVEDNPDDVELTRIAFREAKVANDLVVARDAKFGAAFVKMGLMPDMGALWSLQQRVGPAKAREILGLARSFAAARRRIGQDGSARARLYDGALGAWFPCGAMCFSPRTSSANGSNSAKSSSC